MIAINRSSLEHLIYAVISILILIGSNNAYAVSEIEWNRTYGDYSSNIDSIVQTSDGGYVFAGSIYGENAVKAWLAKIDKKGDLLWERKFGRSKEDKASSIILADDGGFVLAGSTTVYKFWFESYDGDIFQWLLYNILSMFMETKEIWVMKTDENGNEVWKNQFSEAYHLSSPEVLQTYEGGYLIIGQAWTHDPDNRHAWLIKTDDKGKEEWTRKYGKVGLFDAHSGLQTGDGGFIIAGAGFDDQKAILFKTDGNGIIQWKKNLTGIGSDIIYSVYQTKDNGYIVSGRTAVYESDDGGAWLVRTDSEGNEKWNRTYLTKYDRANSALQTSDLGYVLAGWYEDEGKDAIKEKSWIIKADINGNPEWNKSFGGWGYNKIFSFHETKDGGFIIAGICGNKDTGSRSCLIKLGHENP